MTADDGVVCSTLGGVLFFLCLFVATRLLPIVELLSTVRLFFMRIRENSLDDDKAIRRVST
jgi:hypothetical protein